MQMFTCSHGNAFSYLRTVLSLKLSPTKDLAHVFWYCRWWAQGIVHYRISDGDIRQTIKIAVMIAIIAIVADRKHASTYWSVAFLSVHTGIEPPFFIKNVLCDHCLHGSGLYIQKILTKREMINCQKFNCLLIFNNKFCHYMSVRIERD